MSRSRPSHYYSVKRNLVKRKTAKIVSIHYDAEKRPWEHVIARRPPLWAGTTASVTRSH